ncbi:hypothetical protein [Burkholderia glumae]|uniref:hypothetical protein n=1 Tax=Burkholderia glumae TaxID=337 RepID=UPI0015948AC2|nr:hypothetical protein [Burkholderia glumae]NVE23850.1 hypothetical protein [Burkholderia glumae]
MATKQQRDVKPAVKKTSRSTGAVSVSQSDEMKPVRSFGLTEFSVTDVVAKRLMPNALARRGKFELDVQFSVNPFKATEAGLIPALRIKVMCGLNAFSLTRDEEGGDVVGEKSFSIKIEAAARFKVNGVMPKGEGPTAHEISQLMANVYPLVVVKMQQYAADMGYRNISPELNVGEDIEVDVEE